LKKNQSKDIKFIISNYLKVSIKKAKWSKVRAKTVDYFKTISIPGVSRIVTTESFLLKLLWTVVILCVFGFGFDNISQAVADYYKFDKITNIERVYPQSVTFPAITICTGEGYLREHYKNGLLVKTDRDSSNLLVQFLDFNRTSFDLFKNKSILSIRNHLDTFKINFSLKGTFFDCLRFNAVTNRSVELFKASSIDDVTRIFFKNFYQKDISNIEYYRYTFSDYFLVFVGDNSLNSFENLQYLIFKTSNISLYLRFEIEKVSIETKLPEPYNLCKKSSVDEPFHQMDCIEAYIYKEIKNKYNCTFHSTFFSIQGFGQCVLGYRILKDEFSASCRRECPLESCFSEKFTFDSTITSLDPGYTAFRFVFRDLSTLNISQIPKTDPFTFLNNIGGGLGLFMGIAFPNLIEFFQFILEIVLIIFIRKIN
jgi:hypothetical protein